MLSGKLPYHVVVTKNVNGLWAIHQPWVNLVTWRRPVNKRLRASVGQFPKKFAGTKLINLYGKSSFLQRRVEKLKKKMPWAKPLLQDMIILTRIFGRLTGNQRARFGLQIHAIPPKEGAGEFHVDNTKLVMLCAYSYSGVEWLPNAYIACDKRGCFTLQDGYTRALNRVRRFDVAVVKGTAYSGNKMHALPHRSPSNRKNRRHRLLGALYSYK